MRPVDQGKLEVDWPLREIVPDLAIDSRWEWVAPVTLAQCLEHTADFDDMQLNYSATVTAPRTPDLREMRRGGERPSFLLAASPKTGPWYFVMMASREEIASRIDRAFEGASMPNTERELAEPSIDAPYVVAHFLGRSRMDLDGSNFLPGLHMEDFTYMTLKAVTYYLPPVLKLMLIQPYDSELWIYLSGFLGGARHAHGKTLRGLLRAQHEAIADWLEFLCGEMDIGSFGYDQKAEELAQLYRGLAATAQPS